MADEGAQIGGPTMDDDLRSMIAEYRQLSTANVSDGLAHLLQLAPDFGLLRL